ncbi:DUF6933 domain-containing protein [Paenibacillus ihbetae]|uniref:DUF6933 domain-containing protein n=1 Tax=Paenibacillus ihbetae TaxID=1870820 RepID=A0A1B2E5H8_9BACL|nr:hypothetical protein [Paenibacillus ihbetae]ANY75213.1 hypothetical protein BBD41_23030 [Paenibacillus ihbetae]OOC62611.1 hypothetical protein BBD40_12510 [Paenibacillus ihbetae]
MIILRLTQSLLKDMKTTPMEVNNDVPSLFSWHANIYHLNKRKHIVFVNDLTRLTVIIDGVRTGQLTKMQEKFMETLEEYLLAEGIDSSNITSFLQNGSDITISKTNNRSVLGTMKEVAFFSEDDFIDNIARMKWLNRLIYKPIAYKRPINLFKETISIEFGVQKGTAT